MKDSVDRIVGVQLASLTRDPLSYKGVIYQPKPIRVSPDLFRGFTCPERCGACCIKVTLDYIPSEWARLRGPPSPKMTVRQVTVNERPHSVYSDLQQDHQNYHCRNLSKETGRCGIYDRRPFACDFELIRFSVGDDVIHLTQRLYGRAWAKMRIDGERGTMCEMTPIDPATTAEVLRKLLRLGEWADYFEVRTWIPEIISWAESPLKVHPLFLGARE